MHNTHRLHKCNTIQIHTQGHHQVSIISKHVCKTNIKKIQILKFNGISLQIPMAALHQRIDYKILTLTHKCIQEQAPKYLQDLINIMQKQGRNLRSNDAGLLLSQPCIKNKTFASRSLKFAALYLWNHLPKQLRDTKELPQLKKLLKTHLFNGAFSGLNIK